MRASAADAAQLQTPFRPPRAATTRGDTRRAEEGPERRAGARSGRRLTSGADPTAPGARRGARRAHVSPLPQTRSHQRGRTWLRRSRTPRERAEDVLGAGLSGPEVPPSPSPCRKPFRGGRGTDVALVGRTERVGQRRPSLLLGELCKGCGSRRNGDRREICVKGKPRGPAGSRLRSRGWRGREVRSKFQDALGLAISRPLWL